MSTYPLNEPSQARRAEICGRALRRKPRTSAYRITNQRQLRREFWQTFPQLPRRKIANYSGNGKMHVTDTRCAFVDWLDSLSKNGDVSQDLAGRATL